MISDLSQQGITAIPKLLPTNVCIMLELAHPSMMVANRQAQRHHSDLNQFVDAVLRTIFYTSASLGGFYARRKIIFTSFSPDICAALNWKQPNCEFLHLNPNICPISPSGRPGLLCIAMREEEH